SLFGESMKALYNVCMSQDAHKPADKDSNSGQSNKDKYMKIRLNSLPPMQPIPFDLYVAIGNHHVHYLRSGDRLVAEKIKNFEKKAPEAFYILASDRGLYQKFVRDGLVSSQLDTKQKALILRESTLVLVEELFERPDIEQSLQE